MHDGLCTYLLKIASNEPAGEYYLMDAHDASLALWFLLQIHRSVHNIRSLDHYKTNQAVACEKSCHEPYLPGTRKIKYDLYDDV